MKKQLGQVGAATPRRRGCADVGQRVWVYGDEGIAAPTNTFFKMSKSFLHVTKP